MSRSVDSLSSRLLHIRYNIWISNMEGIKKIFVCDISTKQSATRSPKTRFLVVTPNTVFFLTIFLIDIVCISKWSQTRANLKRQCLNLFVKMFVLKRDRELTPYSCFRTCLQFFINRLFECD